MVMLVEFHKQIWVPIDQHSLNTPDPDKMCPPTFLSAWCY